MNRVKHFNTVFCEYFDEYFVNTFVNTFLREMNTLDTLRINNYFLLKKFSCLCINNILVNLIIIYNNTCACVHVCLKTIQSIHRIFKEIT